MAILRADEYTKEYFDGKFATYKHNAGYDRYQRIPQTKGVDSLGEIFKDRAKRIFDKYQLLGARVLEIGCAKGFIVEDLRSFGVDCYGLDVSSYAVGEATPEVAPFLTVGDARTELLNYGVGEFDVVFSLRVMECFTDLEIPDLVKQMNRISKFQFHEIDEFIGYENKTEAMQFYNSKLASDWLNYKWSKNSVVSSHENKSKEMVK